MVNKYKYKNFSSLICNYLPKKWIIMCLGETLLNYCDLSSPAECLCCLNHYNGKGWSVNWIVYFVCRGIHTALCTKHYSILYLVTASNTLQKLQGVQRQWNHYRILCFPLVTTISVNLKKKKLYCGIFEHKTNENFNSWINFNSE